LGGKRVGILHRVRGNTDKNQCTEILDQPLIPSARQMFGEEPYTSQQDNDPKHKAIATREYMTRINILVIHCPSQSPDLNPIESLWSILDYMAKARHPRNENEFFEILKEEWGKITVSILRRVAESMHRRLDAVIKANGYTTKY